MKKERFNGMTVARQAGRNENFDILDIAKFICSIFVVGIHSELLYDYSPILNLVMFRALARLAVPLFFLMSAFFLYRNGEPSWEGFKKYIQRMLVLYLCWFVVHFPKICFDRFYCSSHPWETTVLVFLKSFFTTSTFSGSWFLASCIFSALVLFFVSKLKGCRDVVLIGICLLAYFFCVSSSAYGKLIYSEATMKKIILWFAKPYTSILVGIPYFAIGKMMAEHQIGKSRWLDCRIFLIAMVLISVALLITEAVLTIWDYHIAYSSDCFLFLLPCSVAIFLLLLAFRPNVKWSGSLRKYSTIIFFSHFLWLFLVEFFEWLTKSDLSTVFKFSFALLGSLLTSAFLLRLEKQQRMAWVRFFH